MYPHLSIIHCIFLLLFYATAGAQVADSSLENLLLVRTNYLKSIDNKIQQYSDGITTKTIKTLTRLSRWENKIHSLLKKVNPEAASNLFGNGQLTFTSLLEKIKEGEATALNHRVQYNNYRDDLAVGLQYLALQRQRSDSGFIKAVLATFGKMKGLAMEEDNSDAIQQFIRERKKQLMELAFQHIGKSRYLAKINKEAYYYTETLKNFKELFADSKKAEKTVKGLLERIPAFQNFRRQNSQLASLFGQPTGDLHVWGLGILDGLQTGAGVRSLIQERIASGGPNAPEVFRQNIRQAQGEFISLKDKVLSSVSGAGAFSGGELPDFKPNMQKTKTFLQRLEYGFNLQFDKSNRLLPATSDIAFNIGYKINDRSILGAGLSYKLGIGSIQQIRFSHQGIGLRTYMDWKLKKQFFVRAGYELNHNSQFENIRGLKDYRAWQRSALIGLTKKINIQTKWFKSTDVQLSYDFLSRQHIPLGKPVLFRVGYHF